MNEVERMRAEFNAAREATMEYIRERKLEREIEMASERAESQMNAQIVSRLCTSFALALDRKLCQACQRFAVVMGTTTIKPIGDGRFQAEKPYGFRCLFKNAEVDPLQNNEPCFAPAHKAVMDAK